MNFLNDEKRRRSYRYFLCVLLFSGIIAIAISTWYMYFSRVPSTIKLRADAHETVDFNVPATGDIVKEAFSGSVKLDLSRPVIFKTGISNNNYIVDLKLFGIIPLKSVQIDIINDTKLMPAGIPIGIYVKTKGILVVGIGEFEGEGGKILSPGKYILQPGDYILSINGEEVKDKARMIEIITNGDGEAMVFVIERDEEEIELKLKPEQNKNGELKIGVWVRDNAQGVGTMTYIKEDGTFGALGHGINDIDISTLMILDSGSLYRTDIINITRGVNGAPGELTGFIEYNEQNVLGEITDNTPYGIFGSINVNSKAIRDGEFIPIGLKQDIRKGPAKIILSIIGEPTSYDVEITEIFLDNDNVNRGIVLKITDPALLSLTGGIVQGMSGSPIIQDNKLIGAITHVLVQDSTSGYGIFIENMIIR
ncbi:MAG: SpoIVB peptidase [Lachnospiraceae bacterium]|nr:SpoIVB peptidase [Lachnospiraceae bacterium]